MTELIPSGIILPGDKPLLVTEEIEGLYVVENTYDRDYGYFNEAGSLIAKSEPIVEVGIAREIAR